MGNRTEIAHELAHLLDQHQEEIAAVWADRIFQNASFRPGDRWLDVLVVSTARGLKAMVETLITGSDASLIAYLSELSLACLRSGYESGEVTEALLLCKDAVLPVLARLRSPDLDDAWALNSELDSCLRWMVGHFNTVYAAEMNRRLKQQHEHIMSMLKLGEKPPGALDIDEVLRHIAQGIITSVESDHCNFYLVNESQSRLIPRLGMSTLPLPQAMIQHFLNSSPDPGTDVFMRQVLEQKQPLVCADAQVDPRVNKEIVGPLGAKSVLAVPLVAHNRVLAVAMTGTFHDYRSFTEEQIELAWDIAKAATLVIENARLYEERLAESQSIQRGTSALLQELELEEVFRIVCTEAQRLTGAGESATYLLEDEAWLQRFFNTGQEPAFERIPVDQSLTGMALREGKTFLSNHRDSDQRLFCQSRGIRNMLVAPLIANDRAVGALLAANKPFDFTEDDARIMGIFADQAAIAIENARLHQQLRHMAALEERERLAREIHDNLAQALSILKLQASHVEELLQGAQTAQAQTFLAEMIRTAAEAHADARDAIFSLRHSASSASEFLTTLRAYLDRYRRTYALDAQLVVRDEDVVSLPTNAVIQLPRIIQEAFTNVRKHASANTVVVRLERNDGHLSVTVEDNGLGFDLAEVMKKECGGVGLQIMRERAESLGGHLEVDALPGRGTRVVAQIPFSDRK